MENKTLLRIQKSAPPVIAKWTPYLKRNLLMRRLTYHNGEDKFIRTASLIHIASGGDESRGLMVYQNLVPLIFSAHRIKQWDIFLERMPPTVEAVLRVVESVKAAGLIEPVENSKFNLITFLDVALLLPDPKGYVDVCRREGRTKISGAFHPNTVEFIRARYRGVVGDLANSEYKTQLMETIKTIS